ncbi:ImmA/IrrE family metallo-endopeptidase [Flavihumibacter sp. ZG627]|uniref:ImmA/IrrE family metallo-endopeptidase n=1 Tax=Flavihumibacter sp. ZG627 TaxID=1463156 RepID=UPI0006941F53|nr:ImmA/IrrE family metallo-endopeptidase [Flavihumibacter sp. ZG627]
MPKWNHKSVIRLMEESGNDDPVNEIRTRARNLVLKAFELGWEGPPYSPIELAKFLNIDVIPNDSVTDARIVPLNKKHLQIQYNPFQKPTRINFSVAHEIAHTLFSDCEDDIRNREDEPQINRQLEQLCNTAAAEIQLPYAVFSNDANTARPSIEGLIELATKYKASLESVFIRYTEVIDKPCAILIGIFQTDSKIVIDYYKASKHFNLQVPDSFEVPSNSKAYECTSPGWTSRESESWGIFKNEEYNIFSIGISPYRRDNKPRVGILILPMHEQQKSISEDRIVLEYGDATKPRGNGIKIIAQVVNTSGGLGIGFGKALAKNYPVVKKEMEKWHSNKGDYILGNTNLIQVNDTTYVFQMLAQKGLYPKGNEIPLKYNELRNCLIQLAEAAHELKASVHMPQIGAGQAKGDWNIILGMIHDELISKEIKVNIYLLPGKAYNPKVRSNLTIFKEDSTWETGKLF